MVTYSVFVIAVGVVLLLARKRVSWGAFTLGLTSAFLLLATPLGGPLNRAVASMAAALQQALNGILRAMGVH